MIPSVRQLVQPRVFSTSASCLISRVTLLGNLTADPERSTTQNGQEMAKYTIATNHGMKENRRTSFWDVTCFDEAIFPRLDALGKG